MFQALSLIVILLFEEKVFLYSFQDIDHQEISYILQPLPISLHNIVTVTFWLVHQLEVYDIEPAGLILSILSTL